MFTLKRLIGQQSNSSLGLLMDARLLSGKAANSCYRAADFKSNESAIT